MTLAATVKAWLEAKASGPDVYKRDFDQKCVALAYQTLHHFGHVEDEGSYANAADVLAHSSIASHNPKTAPAGTIGHYIKAGTVGDIAISLGDDKWLHATSHLATGEELAPGSSVGILTSAQYESRSGYTFGGWSRRFGAKGMITFPSTSAAAAASAGKTTAAVKLPLTRRVTASRVHAHLEPRAGSKIMGTHAKGVGIDMTGYVHGENVRGSHLWYVTPRGYYMSAEDFTTQSTAGLKQLTELATDATPLEAPTSPVAPATTGSDSTTVSDAGAATTAPAPVPAPAVVATLTPAQLDALAATIPQLEVGGAPLAGLISGNVPLRKRLYASYAGAALVVSFIPDVVVSGLLAGHAAGTLTTVAILSSSILLKIGVAFGFVAASNTK